MRRYLLVFSAAAIVAMTGCADDKRLSQISDFVPTKFSETSAGLLLHAVAVGETTGGANLLNTAGMSDGMFTSVMTNTLKRNALLAPPGGARWRIDSALDIGGPATIFGDHSIRANIRYVLRDVGTGTAVFDKVVQTSSTRGSQSTAAEVSTILFTGTAMLEQRQKNSIDIAVRANLDGFLTALATWDGARQ